MSCGCNFKVVTGTTTNKAINKLTKCTSKKNTSINIFNMIEEFLPFKHYAKNSLVMFEDMLYIATDEVYPSMVNNCCGNTGSPEYPDNSTKWNSLVTQVGLEKIIESLKEQIDNVTDFTVTDTSDVHSINLITDKKSYNIEIPKNKADASVKGNVLTIVKPDGTKVTFRDTNNTYQAGNHLTLIEDIFNVTPDTLVDGDTTYVENGKLKAKQYDDTKIKNKVSELEINQTGLIKNITFSKVGSTVRATLTYQDGNVQTKTFTDNDTIYDDSGLQNQLRDLNSRIDNLPSDKYITKISSSRTGNTVTLTYTYSDNTSNTVSFNDNDTIMLAYDDSELRRRITTLENKPVTEATTYTATNPISISNNNEIGLNYDPRYFRAVNSQLTSTSNLYVSASIKNMYNMEMVTIGVGDKRYPDTVEIAQEETDAVRNFNGTIFIKAYGNGFPMDAPDEWLNLPNSERAMSVDMELIGFNYGYNYNLIEDNNMSDGYIQRAYLRNNVGDIVAKYERTTLTPNALNPQPPLAEKTPNHWSNWIKLNSTINSNDTFVDAFDQPVTGV